MTHITLARWKELERRKKAAAEAINQIRQWVTEELTGSMARPKDDEAKTLLVLKQISDITEDAAFAITRLDVHPQSEWMGGNSDSPANHRLREPHIVPRPQRYFTPEELEEAGAECLGPCQWRFAEPKPSSAT